MTRVSDTRADAVAEGSEQTYVRLSINVSEELARTLKTMADEQHTTVTNVVRRAVGITKYLQDADADGKVLQLRDEKRNELTTLALI